MTFEALIAELKQRLKPFNSNYDIVKMGINSNYGYMDAEFIRKAITCFEQKAMVSLATGEPLSPLEALGVILLLDSAELREQFEF